MQPTIAALIGLPPPIALLGTVIFVWYLFRRDIRQRPNVTGAVWLPIIWVVLMGSRSISQWLAAFNFPIAVGSSDEGNPLDALVYLSLIFLGFNVLNKSILLTEPDPDEALLRLMKRSAYILVTFSILAIKYYPEVGRRFDEWTGLAVNVGISQSKNTLGCACLVLGFFFIWRFLRIWRTERSKVRRDELRLLGVLLLMIAYLLRKSHDATATLCLLIAITLIFVTGRQWFNKKLIGTYVVAALVGLVAAELAFGVFEQIGDLTGHSSTLMGRMELWRECLAVDTNPIFGVGFESFWVGDRLHLLREGRAWQPTEAHNGYLETYLNLGFVGLFMLFGLIIATFRKIRLDLFRTPDWGRFELGFLAAIVFYNLTEATFKGLSLTWFIFFIVAMKHPIAEYGPASQDSQRRELEEDLVYAPE